MELDFELITLLTVTVDMLCYVLRDDVHLVGTVVIAFFFFFYYNED
jgi:hypothetical protein